MTKDEAMQAMREGKKVAHQFFSPDEWMMHNALGIEFEDGNICTLREFWHYRTDDYWQDGWRVVE